MTYGAGTSEASEPARLSERIVELSAFVAAPLTGMTLAGLGCDVIRVDPPGGGLDFARWPVTATGDSIFWVGLNRGKRSIVIDVRRREGRELVAAMVLAGGGNSARGGIFLTNLGADGPLRYESLSKQRTDVISVEIEGYPGGRSAVDYTIAAGTGVPFLTGPEGHVGPVNSPLPTWDVATGLSAALALQSAISCRQQTGAGTRARVALADVAFELLSALGFVDEARLSPRPRQRDGNYLYGAFGRDFELADGARVMLVAITPKQWRSLVSALELGRDIDLLEGSSGLDLSQEGDRWQARREIAALVEHWCASRELAEAARTFDAHQVCWGPYGTAASFFDGRGNNMVASQVRVPGGELAGQTAGLDDKTGTAEGRGGADPVASGLIDGSGLPIRFGDEQVHPFGKAPVLGQHTDEVLATVLGLSQYEIGRLHDNGLVIDHQYPMRARDLGEAAGGDTTVPQR
jgi:2-methylfumaryl-CoA isomerase